MYNIWFEGDVPLEYASMFSDIAAGISPSGRVDQAPFYQIGLADAVLAGGRTYDAAVMDQAPRLLLISRLGIGYEKVDIEAATARNIAVCNTPDAPTISTAECAVTLMMGVARNVKRVENDLRTALQAGIKKSFYSDYVALELNGLQLGLVGLGRIGGHVAKIATGLGMRVAAYDPFMNMERAAQLGVQVVSSLEELLATSDVVSLHLPLLPETYKIMNAERFAQMKRGAIFINVARGGHVDELALISALESGHLFGAGLDVTDPEPPEVSNPLLYRDNVILMPHIASSTQVGRRRIFTAAMEQVLQALRGEQPPNLINPEVWPHVMERWQATRSE